ncbi:hypothetical protein KY290_029449 [Solanum tuberosum]|uniref:Uncharacterized protein n=1 Tax=Solanum tuberosum TaxID=4113 RepID=A0ABQ7UMT0_SOLTU|nr:hypothetical protein KY285_028507 [Solanum tuberosum]KAH0750217.1 hypothetical protein KY290_029449 [Solanum tuberosum]
MVQHRRGTEVVQAAPLHKEAEMEQYTTRQTTGIRARVSSGGGLLAVHGGLLWIEAHNDEVIQV